MTYMAEKDIKDEDVTTWDEDDDPESLMGEDVDDDQDYERNWGDPDA